MLQQLTVMGIMIVCRRLPEIRKLFLEKPHRQTESQFNTMLAFAVHLDAHWNWELICHNSPTLKILECFASLMWICFHNKAVN